MAFDVLLSTTFLKQIEILRFFHERLQEHPAMCFDIHFFYKNLVVLHHGG